MEYRSSVHTGRGTGAYRTGCIIVLALALAVILPCRVFPEPLWIFFGERPSRNIDEPLPAGLIGEVERTGARIRTVSRYFNAVSVDWEGDTGTLEQLPGVASVRPVRSMGTIQRIPEEHRLEKAASSSNRGLHALNYGISLEQLDILGIPGLHDRGYSGNGVTIGILDTGFDIGETGCLGGVMITHTRNFVRGGEDVTGDDHGSRVLACLGGGLDGEYYGAAYRAAFVLAVTDDLLTEHRADEDRWVAGVEWCDSLGVDIVSSSLVYNIFDTPDESYAKSDMDGRTSLVARAAEIAFSRGILVVNAAGNEGGNSWHIITTPADAEHVLAVGAVSYLDSSNPVISVFSSRGPTADGRIKPDIVAPGVSVRVPQIGSTGFYVSVNGTSFATPFISGLCALLMEAHPDWSLTDIVRALKYSAIDLGDPGPDNDYGWGLPDAVQALSYVPVIVSSGEDLSHGADGNNSTRADTNPIVFELSPPFPNPFNASVTIPFTVLSATHVSVTVHDVTGRSIATIWDNPASPGIYSAVWNSGDCASGVYLVRASTGTENRTRKILLVK